MTKCSMLFIKLSILWSLNGVPTTHASWHPITLSNPSYCTTSLNFCLSQVPPRAKAPSLQLFWLYGLIGPRVFPHRDSINICVFASEWHEGSVRPCTQRWMLTYRVFEPEEVQHELPCKIEDVPEANAVVISHNHCDQYTLFFLKAPPVDLS
ncbi:hypothetical protein ARMSODRAFT_203600 [Armillaria solidipes]|uniref:Uncharacterized protein n=1 Tax=Armillaria solidipes TaxID=1076256 RepID=A0A2H3BZH2_9AGAR|nr:hypothetical protein ARMSODRAFT_203600 [Armillaria solidipes]